MFLQKENKSLKDAYKDSENVFLVFQTFGFIIFLFFMPIIIMNMMIGIAVDDIHGVMERAKKERIKNKVCLETFQIFSFINLSFSKQVFVKLYA